MAIGGGENGERPRVGLVLSGGGAKGIAHVGVLKVIEELGIPIDYIGGTSMGSIVGGLYALGYTPEQLETYLKEADWEDLLTNRVLRRHVSLYEKGERKRYWLQIPIIGHRIELPLGFLWAQNVSNLFTELASPAYDQSDFSKFPIPFLCVATDIESGSEVVLEHGNLAKSMRASMAIPSLFTPEVIDGKRLYDGGLINNFPANHLRDKGIDILIGVDVGSQETSKELNNIYQVMEQVVFMWSLPLKEANRQMCSVLIIPDIHEFSASSFNAVDSLIVRGERAARLHYDDLKALADSLRAFESAKPEEQAMFVQPLTSFYVKEIQINGLHHISRDFFMQKLDLNFPSELTFAQLDHALEKIKGTQFFLSIVYQLNPLSDETEFTSSEKPMVELQFDCVEHSANMLRAGLHYDPEYKASLLLNLILRNVLMHDSKASAEVSIGTNPSFSLSFLHSPGVKITKSGKLPDWLAHINGHRLDAYNYSRNQRTTSYSFSSLSTGLQLFVNPSINSAIGGGFVGDYSTIRTKIGNENVTSEYFYLSYRFFYERDTYNEDYFPTKGGKFRLEGTYHKGLSKNVRQSEGFFGVMLRSNFACTPAHRWTLYSGINAGSVFGDNIAPQYMMRLGGMPDKHLYHHISFAGMYFLQKFDKNAWVAHLNNQILLWNNVYLTFRTQLGKISADPADLITLKDFKIGCGISLQYNTVVGPLGFTLSSSNVTNSLLGAFHLGYWF